MAAEGYLICAVYTANARLPVPGALVTILKRDPGSASQLLAIRLTDSSGRTAPVAIETPGAATSSTCRIRSRRSATTSRGRRPGAGAAVAAGDGSAGAAPMFRQGPAWG